MQAPEAATATRSAAPGRDNQGGALDRLTRCSRSSGKRRRLSAVREAPVRCVPGNRCHQGIHSSWIWPRAWLAS